MAPVKRYSNFVPDHEGVPRTISPADTFIGVVEEQTHQTQTLVPNHQNPTQSATSSLSLHAVPPEAPAHLSRTETYNLKLFLVPFSRPRKTRRQLTAPPRIPHSALQLRPHRYQPRIPQAILFSQKNHGQHRILPIQQKLGHLLSHHLKPQPVVIRFTTSLNSSRRILLNTKDRAPASTIPPPEMHDKSSLRPHQSLSVDVQGGRHVLTSLLNSSCQSKPPTTRN